MPKHLTKEPYIITEIVSLTAVLDFQVIYFTGNSKLAVSVTHCLAKLRFATIPA